MMFYKFRKIAEKYRLWEDTDTLLIAVSGGLDSMVLLELCRQLYNSIAVVHCNFSLRNEASDDDEQLVREICKNHNLTLHTKKFDTISYAKENAISIEMAARDLRYAYFDELCYKNDYDKILTAHHANDNAETLLLNLTKGTGIKGLTGIPRKRDNIVRPLLEFTRQELSDYATRNKLVYHVDATNKETIYQRNKIRHDVIPLLEEINPRAVKTLNADTERLQEVRDIYEEYIQEKLETLIANNELLIDDLISEKHSHSLLFEWLTPFGFSSTVIENILSNIEDTEEKHFKTAEHRLIKSRGKLYLTSLKRNSKKDSFSVTKKGIESPIHLKIEPFDGKIQADLCKAYFDLDKLQFPLQLRRWREGDRFFPFGMQGSKKVSELFKDKKLTTLAKENTWILCSGETIIWVVGLRSDDRFKIMPQTKQAIKITWIK
ncbi:tRNA(Ile)-lysidine synthase [Balneicella halophila]|uniref:tRNA(Ile)-lysidine synthase n=1 Tax=Balneicella halophila TaxID=1537566 RepID=A0A7L4UQD9_BALHA|nr:tRNA lysidine(34) synthetase TilS [Balneicella halophila]PVX51889.1 tRNA(Ile)-lysidine synthase [Balneicella halophila]